MTSSDLGAARRCDRGEPGRRRAFLGPPSMSGRRGDGPTAVQCLSRGRRDRPAVLKSELAEGGVSHQQVNTRTGRPAPTPSPSGHEAGPCARRLRSERRQGRCPTPIRRVRPQARRTAGMGALGSRTRHARPEADRRRVPARHENVQPQRLCRALQSRAFADAMPAGELRGKLEDAIRRRRDRIAREPRHRNHRRLRAPGSPAQARVQFDLGIAIRPERLSSGSMSRAGCWRDACPRDRRLVIRVSFGPQTAMTRRTVRAEWRRIPKAGAQSRMIYSISATTPVAPEVAAAMRPWIEEKFANPLASAGEARRGPVEVARDQSSGRSASGGRFAFTRGDRSISTGHQGHVERATRKLGHGRDRDGPCRHRRWLEGWVGRRLESPGTAHRLEAEAAIDDPPRGRGDAGQQRDRGIQRRRGRSDRMNAARMLCDAVQASAGWTIPRTRMVAVSGQDPRPRASAAVDARRANRRRCSRRRAGLGVRSEPGAGVCAASRRGGALASSGARRRRMCPSCGTCFAALGHGWIVTAASRSLTGNLNCAANASTPRG